MPGGLDEAATDAYLAQLADSPLRAANDVRTRGKLVAVAPLNSRIQPDPAGSADQPKPCAGAGFGSTAGDPAGLPTVRVPRPPPNIHAGSSRML